MTRRKGKAGEADMPESMEQLSAALGCISSFVSDLGTEKSHPVVELVTERTARGMLKYVIVRKAEEGNPQFKLSADKDCLFLQLDPWTSTTTARHLFQVLQEKLFDELKAKGISSLEDLSRGAERVHALLLDDIRSFGSSGSSGSSSGSENVTVMLDGHAVTVLLKHDGRRKMNCKMIMSADGRPVLLVPRGVSREIATNFLRSECGQGMLRQVISEASSGNGTVRASEELPEEAEISLDGRSVRIRIRQDRRRKKGFFDRLPDGRLVLIVPGGWSQSLIMDVLAEPEVRKVLRKMIGVPPKRPVYSERSTITVLINGELVSIDIDRTGRLRKTSRLVLGEDGKLLIRVPKTCSDEDAMKLAQEVWSNEIGKYLTRMTECSRKGADD